MRSLINLARRTFRSGNVGDSAARTVDTRPITNAKQPRSLSYRSLWSVLSASSVLSVASAVSLMSIGSFASILSIGSSNSVLSIGSDGGFLSIGGSRGRRRLERPGAGETTSARRG
jgi:hypothetical protein